MDTFEARCGFKVLRWTGHATNISRLVMCENPVKFGEMDEKSYTPVLRSKVIFLSYALDGYFTLWDQQTALRTFSVMVVDFDLTA